MICEILEVLRMLQIIETIDLWVIFEENQLFFLGKKKDKEGIQAIPLTFIRMRDRCGFLSS